MPPRTLKMLLGFLVILLIGLVGYFWVGATSQTPPVITNDIPHAPETMEVDAPNLSNFIPAQSSVLDQVNVDFQNGGAEEVAVVYGAEANGLGHAGILILEYKPGSGWKPVFESQPIQDVGVAIDIEPFTTPSNETALLVVETAAGAGVSRNWFLVNNKYERLMADDLRNEVLAEKENVFLGYNGVVVKDGMVVETIAGYSQGAARCCPDKPDVIITYTFENGEIKVDNVKEGESA